MVRIHTDLFSSEMEGVFTVVHCLQFVMITEVWVAPEFTVDYMRQAFLGPNLVK